VLTASEASLTDFPITDIATISTGVKTYTASACFSLAKIARIFSPCGGRSSSISCGVSRFGMAHSVRRLFDKAVITQGL
jgi:hypothetical protein